LTEHHDKHKAEHKGHEGKPKPPAHSHPQARHPKPHEHKEAHKDVHRAGVATRERPEGDSCEVPWRDEYAFSRALQSLPTTVGSTVTVLTLHRWATAFDLTFQPNGVTLTAGAFAVDVYVEVKNISLPVGSMILIGSGSSLPQILPVRGVVGSAWVVKLRRALAGTATFASTGQAPSFNAIAHGREYSS
jgi:hypothetical protein